MGVRVIYALGPHILKSFKEFSVSFELLQWTIYQRNQQHHQYKKKSSNLTNTQK
jgi:hypothetical protein